MCIKKYFSLSLCLFTVFVSLQASIPDAKNNTYRRSPASAAGSKDTLNIIQSPLINIPAIALPGDTVDIRIDLDTEENAEIVHILFNGYESEINFRETGEMFHGLRTLEAYLPDKLLYGLYDIRINCSGQETPDISKQALYVIPAYQDTFTFIHVTDTHLPSHYYWGDEEVYTDSTELEDFRAVIDDINIINPEFVLHTGDLINDGELEALGIPSISRSKKILHELNVPLFIVPGNHDLGGWDAAPAPDGTARRTWWKYFGWKYLDHTPSGTVKTQNYSFNYGNAHFTGLESYINYDGWRYNIYGYKGFTDEQLDWLDRDLAASQNAELRVLFYHYDFENDLDLSALDVDAAFWGHIHYNSGSLSTKPCDISTGAVCDGRRWYRVVRVTDNAITDIRALQAGTYGELITKTVTSDKKTVRLSNNSNMDLDRCLVHFPLEEGKRLVSLSNADFFQLDSLSSPRIVYAHADLPANSSVTASIETEDIPQTGVSPVTKKIFPVTVYPNPFNPETCISFIAPENMTLANIRILDIYGRTVHTINKKALYPGKHELIWNASGQPSGIYFINISGDIAGQDFSRIKKCVVMK